MLKRVFIASAVVLFAFVVLLISVFRTASVKYEFTGPVEKADYNVLGEKTINVNYELAFPGRVLPDSTLWPLKALRDRIWLWITTSDTRQIELLLLFADKRVASSKILFEKEKFDIGFTTLTKAEKYLERASLKEESVRKGGGGTDEILQRLANASLKHFLVMEEMLTIAPDDAKPKIIEVQDGTKRIYERSRNALLEKGIAPPENPFDWK
jgi:hypothetical protein